MKTKSFELRHVNVLFRMYDSLYENISNINVKYVYSKPYVNTKCVNETISQLLSA